MDTVSVSGSVVTITLVTAVFTGDAVTVDYTASTDGSAARLQDLAGNAASLLQRAAGHQRPPRRRRTGTAP